MAEAAPAFVQPIVACNLSRGLVLEDVIFALGKLQKNLDDLFDGTLQRIRAEKVRLDEVNERIGRCEGKIDAIRGATHAVIVFSSAKYPASGEACATFAPLHADRAEAEALAGTGAASHCVPDEDPEREYTIAAATARSVAEHIAEENLRLFARLNAHGSDLRRVEVIMEDEGLGPFPDQARSVSDILLFNSNEAPHRSYAAADNLLGVDGAPVQVEEPKELAVAPTTLTGGDLLPGLPGMDMDLRYRPQEAEAAALDLPSDLPLPDIADIAWSTEIADALPTIAPSASRAPAAAGAARPPRRAGAEAPTRPPGPPERASLPPRERISLPTPPPPVPQDPPIAREAKPKAPAALPPAALAAAPAAAPAARRGKGGAAQAERTDLLQAIRGNRAEQLRSVEERKASEKKERRPDAGGGSLMDALRDRLRRRHRTISGKNDRAQQRRESRVFRRGRAAEGAVDTDDESSEEGDHGLWDSDAEQIGSAAAKARRAGRGGPDPRRGSLFDESNKVLNRLLSVDDAARDDGGGSSGSDGGWDDSD